MSGYRNYTFTVSIRVHDSLPEDRAMASVESIRAEVASLAIGDVVIIAAGPAFDLESATTVVPETFQSANS